MTLVGNVVMKHVCKELFAPLKFWKASRAHACHYRSRKVRAKLFLSGVSQRACATTSRGITGRNDVGKLTSALTIREQLSIKPALIADFFLPLRLLGPAVDWADDGIQRINPYS